MTKIAKLNTELAILNSKLSEIEKYFLSFDIQRVRNLEAHVVDRLINRSVSDRLARQKDRKAAEVFFRNVTSKDLMRIKTKTFGKRLFFLGAFVGARYHKRRFDYDQDIEPFFVSREDAVRRKYEYTQRLKNLREQLNDLDRVGFGGLFSSKPSKHQYDKKRKELENSISYLGKEPTFTDKFLSDEEYLRQICKLAHQFSNEIQTIDSRIKYLKKETTELNKQEKYDLKMAKAAAFDNETRKHAKTIKSKITKQLNCPYCGVPIKGSSHLDHIHPVSKGGLNVAENLVDCCATCNLKKSDKGVFQFCKEQGFDYQKVCERLLNLGKHV